MANSGSTWGWCLLEGIKNFRLGFSGRLTCAWSFRFFGRLISCLIHWAALPWMILLWKFFSSHENNGFSSIQNLYLPNPTDLAFFFIRVHLDWQTLFTTFYSFENKKSILFLLFISPWTQIKQLSSDVSLPNLPSVGIKLSNRLSFSKFYNRNLKESKLGLNSPTWCWSMA